MKEINLFLQIFIVNAPKAMATRPLLITTMFLTSNMDIQTCIQLHNNKEGKK